MSVIISRIDPNVVVVLHDADGTLRVGVQFAIYFSQCPQSPPGAIAFLLVRSFGRMLVIAVAVCLVAMMGGAYASFFLDSAPAPTVILILSLMFLLAFVRRLLLTRRASRLRLEAET